MSERVEIDLSKSLGPARQRASGFLASLSPTLPTDDLVRAVKPRLFRLDAATGTRVYGRVVTLGATPQLVPSYPAFKGPATSLEYETWSATWETHLRALVEETIARGETWQWDIWNEPNWPKFWTGTRAEFFDTWRRSHRIIRATLPQAVIVGPSLAYYDSAYLQAFLLDAQSYDVLPDILSWHELSPQSPGAIPGRAEEMRAFLASNGMPITHIYLNEITAPSHQFKPGHLVWFFAALERAGVNAAAKSCWSEGWFLPHNCVNDSLNGLLGGGQPRSAYWAYKAYADIVGGLVEVTPSPSFDGVAGHDFQVARAVIANHSAESSALIVTVNGLASIVGETVRVRIRHIPNTERGALAAPIPAGDGAVFIDADAIEVDLGTLNGWEAVSVEIAR